MVKGFGNKPTRELTRKEKIKRAHWQQESIRIGSAYVYPVTIALVVAFFLGLYAYLYRKSTLN